MPTIEKGDNMPISGMALRAKRTEFYDEMTEKYNVSKEQISKILINGGYEGFKVEGIPGYRALIENYFKEIEKERTRQEKKKVAREKAKGTWEDKVFGTKERLPCPIPECGGFKLFPGPGTKYWQCSKGGTSHCRAEQVARLWAYVNGVGDEQEILNKAKELIDNLEAKKNEQKEKTETDES